MRRLFIIVLCAAVISGCVKKSDKESETSELLGMEQKIISFNLANHTEDGTKKWELKGDSANVMSDVIYLTNISVDTYQEPRMRLTSDDGSYNRKDRIVTLDNNVLLTTSDGLNLVTDSIKWDGVTDVVSTSSPVSIKRSDVLATGLGAKALPEMKKVMLEKDVEVVILKDVMAGVPIKELEQPRPGQKEESRATITCDGPLEIDYEKNIAIFRNNVKVDDKRGQIYSQVMEAYLDPVSKSILKVIAEGGVKVVRGKDSTYSEKAIYTTADQRIVLLGRPEILIHADEEIGSVEEKLEEVKW